MDGLPSDKNDNPSNLHSSTNHLIINLPSSSGESIFTPVVK
jgi:hypothetical protein